MAEYVPFPERSDPADGRDLAKRLAGCLGLGGLGIGAVVVVLVVFVMVVGSFASSCDLTLGGSNEGKDSLHLPVSVTPRTGLTDRSTVVVESGAFDADSIVGVAVCLRSADTERRGAKACDDVQGARYATDGTGKLRATYLVPRVITIGGRAFDCAAKPNRCLVVAADAGDYDQSGGQVVTYQPGLAAPTQPPVTVRPVTDHLPIGADPAIDGPLASGTSLHVLASGFQPGEPLLVAYCTAALEEVGIESCDPEDPSAAFNAVLGVSLAGISVRASDAGAFTTTLRARAAITPISTAGVATTTTTRHGRTPPTGSGPTGSTTSMRREPGQVSCTAASGGCSIVVAAAADTKRSAVLAYTVAG